MLCEFNYHIIALSNTNQIPIYPYLTDYQNTLTLAQTEFDKIISDDVQMTLKNASSDVQSYTDDASTTINAVMQYFK